MARVTVAFPVFNAEKMLAQSLNCILNQTYKDIKVIIADNASNDGTETICKDFVQRDSRVTYLRRPWNIDALPNFVELVKAADTEFFMWRADDDLSDLDYIEKLVNALDKNPLAQLAGSCVITEPEPNSLIGRSPVPELPDGPFIERFQKQLNTYHCSIFYGLWRTGPARETLLRLTDKFPVAYANDQLVILSVLLDDALCSDNTTLFTQRTWARGKPDGLKTRAKLKTRIKTMEKLYPMFMDACMSEIERRNFDAATEKALKKMMYKFAKTRLRATKGRILRWKLKALFMK